MSQVEPGETQPSLVSATVMIFFTTLALLMFQILQTVTLSLQIFHNTAFLVISLCMFGLGGGGSLAAYLRYRGWAVTQRSLWGVSLAFACSLLGTGILYNRMHTLEGLILTGFLPYVFAGLLLPMIFQTWPRHAGRIYFFDLVGSGFGALGLIVLLNGLGDAGKVQLLISEIALAGTLAVALPLSRRVIATTVAVGVAMLALFPVSDGLFPHRPGPTKAYGKILRDPEMKFTRDWSKWSYARRAGWVCRCV